MKKNNYTLFVNSNLLILLQYDSIQSNKFLTLEDETFIGDLKRRRSMPENN